MSARELQTALRRLVGGDEGYSPLAPVPPVGEQPGGVSVGMPSGAAASQSSDAKLAEADYLSREYWSPRFITSPSGLFVLTYRPIRSVALEGGGTFEFKQPEDG